MSENTQFTGQQIKSLSKLKGLSGIVIRVRQNRQTLDFSQDYDMQTTVTIAPSFNGTITLDTPNNDWVEMFPKQQDTTWQFFASALKPKDKVVFYERNNGNQFEEEAGLSHVELRARVTGYRKDGTTIAYMRELTLKCRVIKGDYKG